MYTSNPHLDESDEDILYHLGIARSTHDLPKQFGDVRFVLTGGSARRMQVMANMCAERLPGRPTVSDNLCPTDRFAMYKVGPVLCVNHGMGTASMSVMFNELIKLLHYAKCVDVQIFRIGTSGGLGLEPGTVVITSAAVNDQVKPIYEYCVLGERRVQDTTLDKAFVAQLVKMSDDFDFPVTTGLTMGTSDFYEAQGRLDGAFCNYEEKDKFAFLRKIHALGVRNIEMEATGFVAYAKRAGITKAADVCVTLVDRLQGDQIKSPKETLKEYETRPARLVITHIVNQLN